MRAIQALLLGLTLALPLRAGEVFLTKDEALALAFKDCHIERQTLVLTEKERKQVEKESGHALASRIVHPYVATKNGKLVGTAWFDVHKVRTAREVLMLVIDPKGRIQRLEVLAFGEPKQYLPRATWYAQFIGKKLDETLSLKKGIKKITGATLTARATTQAARRVLAIRQIWKAHGGKSR